MLEESREVASEYARRGWDIGFQTARERERERGGEGLALSKFSDLLFSL